MTQGNAPSAAQVFNLIDAQRLLHSHAHSTDAPAGTAKEQFHAFGSVVDSLIDTADDMELMSEGLGMYLEMLESSAHAMGMQLLHTQQIKGVLQPMRREMARHAATLRAALARNDQ